jgi:antitoxin component HigA of HigAB toxin-antitoxin module
MANELNVSLGQTGLTVTAQLYAAGAAVGSAISMAEIANQGGIYTGAMPGATAAADYGIQFFAGGIVRGSGRINWNGTSEVIVTTPPTVAAIRTEMDTNSIKLANLDATISSRLAASGYTAPTTPPTVAAIRTEMDTNSIKLANLDATISSRLAASGYTAPTTPPTVAAIRTEMDINSTKLDVAVSTRMAAGGGGGGGLVTGFSSDALNQLAGLTIAVQLPSNVSASQGTIELTAGDDYLLAISRSFSITLTGTLPDMSGAAHAYLALTTARRVVRVYEVTIVSTTSTTLVLRVELTATQTSALELGVGTWEPQCVTAAGLKWSVPSPVANPFVLLVDARPS